MSLSVVWIIIIALVFTGIQRKMLFNKQDANKGSIGEKIAFYSLLILGVGLNIALFNDWLLASPLYVLRMLFSPTAEAIARWGLVEM